MPDPISGEDVVTRLRRLGAEATKCRDPIEHAEGCICERLGAGPNCCYGDCPEPSPCPACANDVRRGEITHERWTLLNEHASDLLDVVEAARSHYRGIIDTPEGAFPPGWMTDLYTLEESLAALDTLRGTGNG